nr:14941_t:CDS:2 [Entrophospora candida]
MKYSMLVSMRITIRCLMCDSIAEYSDEPLNSGFNLLAAGSSLVVGLNQAEESAKDTPMECINHIRSLDQNILSVSFDTSWLHLRNANQANSSPRKLSKQMEHAILIAILNKITPILDQHDMLLDICVDGDLDSNKTLRGEQQV